ncbi:MAG: DNA-3-methyladenine glycosylase I [Christensenella sp.]
MEKQISKKRCGWVVDALLKDYHDNEYGRLKTSDTSLFEKLCLESFQAGLSWRTVLVKREAFRSAFSDFNIEQCAKLTDEYLESLMSCEQIIRNRKKIFAVRENARAALCVIEEHGSFFQYIYSFKKPQALLISLKRYGFVFIGPTIMEAFMQSIGILEAHEAGCFLHTPRTEMMEG